MTAASLEGALTRTLRFAVGALMISAVTLNFANVVGRYVFLKAFVWAEEVLQFVNVWVVMLGAALVTSKGSHLKMDVLYALAPPRLRRALDTLSDILALGISLYVIDQSVGVIWVLSATGQRSVIARLPMSLMYAAIPLGFGCGAFFLALWCVRRRRERETPAPETAAPPREVAQ